MKENLSKGKPVGQKGLNAVEKKQGNKSLEPKAAKQSTRKKKDLVAEKAPTKNADLVTLTQAEFNALMETIGKLAMESEKLSGDKADSHPATDQNSLNGHERSRYMSVTAEEYEDRYKGDSWLRDRQLLELKSSTPGEPKPHLSLSERKRLEWQEQNGFTETFWRNGHDSVKTRSEPRPMQSHAENQKHVRLEDPLDSTPRFLTAAEKKKLQWEKERAELSGISDYDPWGRSGGGAPIKDKLGNAVADYSRRKDILLNSGNYPITEPTSDFGAIDPVRYPLSLNRSMQKSQSHPEQLRSVTNEVTLPAKASVESRFMSEKDKQKQEWLQELEKQREEQRLRKLIEKKERREESPERYVWADSTSVASRIRDQQPAQLVGYASEMASQANASTRHSAPPSNGFSADEASKNLSSSGNNTFIRGQNVAIDPVTLLEQHEKRRKYLELQEFNRKQVEERAQKKREEKERRIQEDLEEERKYNQTAPTPKQVTSTMTVPSNPVPEMPPFDRQEVERNREESLRLALEAARLDAEREKKQRLLDKLKRGNHDVSHLEAKFNFGGAVVSTARSIPPAVQVPPPPVVNAPTHVEPRYVPGLGELPSSNHGTMNSNRNAVMENLANYPQRPQKTVQEFSTQTDMNHIILAEMSRDSTEVEYHPPPQPNRDLSKKVRVISAPKQDRRKQQRRAAADVTNLPKQKPNQRPIWGYQNPKHKKPVKQSERDAFHSSDARHQRRIDRQNELLQMMARNSEIVPDYRTIVPSRTRSRSREGCTDDLPTNSPRGQKSYRLTQSRSHSLEPPSLPQTRAIASKLVPSPPVPSVRQQPDGRRDVNKYRDAPALENPDTDFMPFIRSSNVLNPAHAESPMPVSREPSEMEKARRAYQGVLNPAKYGQKLDYDGVGQGLTSRAKDPLFNPSLVTSHPTHRQGQILQQLSTLRQALKEKQREMNGFPEALVIDHPDRFRAGRIISPAYD